MLPNTNPGSRQQPQTAKRDVYHNIGLAGVHALTVGDPLGRMLAVMRLVFGLLCDVARPGSTPGDTPVTLLGQHYLSHRDLGTFSDGSSDRVFIQEICTLDQNEAPRPLRKVLKEGSITQATIHWLIDPNARAKHRRLGGGSYAKISMGGGGQVCFHATHAAGTDGLSAALLLVAPQESYPDEVYEFAMPALILHNPLSSACRIDWKALDFREGGDVKGTLNLDEPAARSLSNINHTRTKLGTVTGNWRGSVGITCPALGLEGVIHEGGGGRHWSPTDKSFPGAWNKASSTTRMSASVQQVALSARSSELTCPVPPPPLLCVDLNRLGPMRLPRLWSALHDALLYNDPARAQGGKASEALSVGLARGLHALFFDPLESRDLMTKSAASSNNAQGTGSLSAAATSRTIAGKGKAKDVEDSDSSDEDGPPPEKRGVAGGLEEKDGGANGNKSLPPCYKVAHEGGKKLRYQLHLTLVRRPNDFLAATLASG